ncbi:hypothetical protein C8039_05340 [Halogeometricum sp. wsp3]|nr:hypothetical protein C8039_05340 [Halogeometricum sp. wsp3]
MKISIITAVYNDPRVERCLDSVASQQGNFEVEHIVVDSESTDDTVDVIEQYENHIDCLISEPDDGMYDASNPHRGGDGRCHRATQRGRYSRTRACSTKSRPAGRDALRLLRRPRSSMRTTKRDERAKRGVRPY